MQQHSHKQPKPAGHRKARVQKRAHACNVTDLTGLVTIEAAAARFGVDVKRLRGWIITDSVRLDHPRGCVECGLVYEASVERYLKRASVGITVVQST